MIYKCLSIVKPNGNNIASGIKTIEVRRWNPSLLPLRDLVIVENDNILTEKYPAENGRVVAMVDVVDVRPWEEKDMKASCVNVFENEWQAWVLSNIREISYPAAVPAKRKIYELELDDGRLQYK